MSFFKAYDMRGTYGVDFDLGTVYRVGKALPQVVKGRRWLVGRDCRVTSKDVRDALVRGLEEAGAEVTDLGLCTTPMVYFFTADDDFDGSVMITASHNPPSDNGLKVSMRTALPVGYANGLNEVERLVMAAAEGCPPISKIGMDGVAPERIAQYVAWMKARSPFPAPCSPFPVPCSLSYAIDCSNGMASLLVHELFPNAVVINDTLDGTFPNHSPNPLKAEAREQVAALVRDRKLDFGIIFDGDADRCMFVDEKGDFVQPDYLIPIVARATLRPTLNLQPNYARDAGKLRGDGAVAVAEEAGTTNAPATARAPSPRNEVLVSSPTFRQFKIIHDVRTSRGAIEELKRMGCEPVMVPVGHAFAKPVLRRPGMVCGGELAGHYYFREFHGCDSGVLAALRIIGEIAAAKAQGKTFSEMMHPISGVYANSGELNFRVEEKDAAIGRVLAVAKAKLPNELSRSEIDGIRIEYAEGWINIRKSNTEPYLRLIAECDTAERLGEWTALLKGAINDEK